MRGHFKNRHLKGHTCVSLKNNNCSFPGRANSRSHHQRNECSNSIRASFPLKTKGSKRTIECRQVQLSFSAARARIQQARDNEEPHFGITQNKEKTMDSQRVEKAKMKNAAINDYLPRNHSAVLSAKVFVLHSKIIDLSRRMFQTPQQKPRALHN